MSAAIPYYDTPTLSTSPPSTVAISLLFGTAIFTYATLFARCFLAGDTRPIHHSLTNAISSKLETKSFQSIYTLLHHSSVFGLILLFAYICEYHPPFPHGEKSYDRDEFFFVTGVVFFAAAYTVTKNDRKGGEKAKEMKEDSKEEVDKTQEKHNGNSGNSSVTSNGDMTEVDLKDVGSSNDTVSEFSSIRRRRVKRLLPVKACNDVLNRDQTEEWKGWMQYMFLLYHYYHAEEVYNSIRIMITCYVWMTGFGNFSFFYSKNEYSFVRVVQMLWRLNFLVFFLCLSQGTTYILYYICPLHTFFFLMVYVCMRVGKEYNYSKHGLRIKLAVMAVVIFLIWDVDTGLFRLLHLLICKETPVKGAANGTMWEWYFRSSLDHWSTFLGMMFAANYPITSLWFRKVECLPYNKQWAVKGAVGISLFMAFYMWLSGPFHQDKLDYNATNAYFGFIPLITYIYFRNLTPTLRSYSLELFHQIGKTTLETYLMQHHIWLTSDAKSLLVLIPGWPKVNMLVVTFLYFYVSRRLYKITLFLRGMFLPDDKKFCIRSIIGIAATIMAFYAVALSLRAMNLVNLPVIAVISILCGFCLYQFIMDTTWSNFRESAPPMTTGAESFLDDFLKNTNNKPLLNLSPDNDSPIARLSPPLIGSLCLLILGLCWQGFSISGASKILPLPATCEAHVNTGHWIPITACNEHQKGLSYRDSHISEMACNSPIHAWGWNTTRPNSHCRFVHRDNKSLKKQLTNYHLIFLGDSMVRNIYHSFLRAMDVTRGGYYDATIAKHSDIKYEIEKERIILEFKWAPLTSDQLAVFQDLNKNSEEKGAKSTPDLVVTGGGAWDRLHLFASDEDQSSLKVTIKELAKEIATTIGNDLPVVWTIPTTINSKALNTEDKREHIKEEDMQGMRDLYASLGILSSSSFVLNGPAYTHERVEECYDGVHYPPSVYDGGTQILANALDWILLPPKNFVEDEFIPRQPGSMAKPMLGLMMLCISIIGLFFFDGFFGFTYFGVLLVKGASPKDMYEEAFGPLHEKLKLPKVAVKKSSQSQKKEVISKDEEIEKLLAQEGDVEMMGLGESL